MGGGADETDAYDYEGVVFDAAPVSNPPGKAAALVVADATFAANVAVRRIRWAFS